MNRYLIVPVAIVALMTLFGVIGACSDGGSLEATSAADGSAVAESPALDAGPNGGRIISAAGLEVETAVDEDSGEPRFRLWVRRDGAPVPGAQVRAVLRTIRLGGARQEFAFAPDGDSLASTEPVPEPHSFDVEVSVVVDGRRVTGSYPSYETRTEIDPKAAAVAGVQAARAGPGTIRQTLQVYGSIVADPQRVREIHARFPGVAIDVTAALGDRVRRGQVLATIESNESLQRYAVASPIDGQIVDRRINAGETVGDELIFTVADLSQVWAEFAIFRRDLPQVRVGQSVQIVSEDGAVTGDGRIAYVTPIGTSANQSLAARVPVDNASGRWAPGLFVTGGIVVAERQVPLAVRNSALQTLRDLPVVFERVGNVYEPRFVELGDSDGRTTEVVGGIAAGAEYIVEQSYLVKADIEKSGAEHSH
jgi:cobalt-zinc-cadmium efflux system membrane fusion protein